MPDSRLPPQPSLLGFITRYVQYGKRAERTVVLSRHADAFLPVYALTQRVRRYSRAYIRLMHDGMASAGQPLVRAALEHAVTAQWVFYSKDGIDRMKVSSAKDHLKFVQDIGSYADDDPYIEQLRAEVQPGPGLQTWHQIREAFEKEKDFLASSYAVLSQAVHVTHAVWFDAISVEEDGSLALRDEPDDFSNDAVTYVLASSCMLSWWLEAVCRGDEHRMRALQDDAHTLSMPASLERRLPPDQLRPDAL